MANVVVKRPSHFAQTLLFRPIFLNNLWRRWYDITCGSNIADDSYNGLGRRWETFRRGAAAGAAR